MIVLRFAFVKVINVLSGFFSLCALSRRFHGIVSEIVAIFDNKHFAFISSVNRIGQSYAVCIAVGHDETLFLIGSVCHLRQSKRHRDSCSSCKIVIERHGENIVDYLSFIIICTVDRDIAAEVSGQSNAEIVACLCRLGNCALKAEGQLGALFNTGEV